LVDGFLRQSVTGLSRPSSSIIFLGLVLKNKLSTRKKKVSNETSEFYLAIFLCSKSTDIHMKTLMTLIKRLKV
jgi:hypothetical protein